MSEYKAVQLKSGPHGKVYLEGGQLMSQEPKRGECRHCGRETETPDLYYCDYCYPLYDPDFERPDYITLIADALERDNQHLAKHDTCEAGRVLDMRGSIETALDDYIMKYYHKHGQAWSRKRHGAVPKEKKVWSKTRGRYVAMTFNEDHDAYELSSFKRRYGAQRLDAEAARAEARPMTKQQRGNERTVNDGQD